MFEFPQPVIFQQNFIPAFCPGYITQLFQKNGSFTIRSSTVSTVGIEMISMRGQGFFFTAFYQW